jgi:hypothetical protein
VSFTYDPSQADVRSRVRFEVRDTVAADAVFQDEEIDAIIAVLDAEHGAGVWTPYCAAARLLGALQAGGARSGSGSLIEKQVGRLKLRFDDQSDQAEVFDAVISRLQKLCAYYMTPRPRVFKAMGGYR